MTSLTEPLLSTVLRASTKEAHGRLEATLKILAPPLSQERFRRVLEQFYGFHSAWEPALATDPDCRKMFQGRSRLEALRTDLHALGRSDGEIDVLPVCAAAAALCRDPSGARGSFYVMEGSTLGGLLIARALADTDWGSLNSLTYFAPYGTHTGVRWRAFKTWLDATPSKDWPGVTEGAVRAFGTLRDWLED